MLRNWQAGACYNIKIQKGKVMTMAKPQSIATVKYEKSQGIIAKSFKMKKELAEEFKATCERIGVGQAATITSLMKDFIEKNKEQ